MQLNKMSMLERFARHNHSLRARRDRPYFKPRPARLSDDGRTNSLFSRHRDIMNQVSLYHQPASPLQPLKFFLSKILSPTIRHFNLDGSNGLSFGRRSPSPRGAQMPCALVKFQCCILSARWQINHPNH